MKTTIDNLINFIRTLRSVYIPIVLVCALAFSSCQLDDEVAPIKSVGPQSVSSEGAQILLPISVPPDEMVRTDYPLATKWRITYNNVGLGHSYRRFFSTLDGSLRTMDELNNSRKATARADMNIMFWYVSSLEEFDNFLTYPEYISATRFKPATFGPWQLAAMTVGNSAQFKAEFDHNQFGATPFQPYNYELNGDESTYVKKGDIFLFKTGRTPAQYGAVHILEKANPFLGTEQTIVEITVQTGSLIVERGK